MIIFILYFIIVILLLYLIYNKYIIYNTKLLNKQFNEQFIEQFIESFMSYQKSGNVQIDAQSEETNQNHSLCSNFYKNSFCQFDIDQNKNMCKYQKDNVKVAFDAPEYCCPERCNNESSSKINTALNNNSSNSNNSIKMPYYCNIGGKCKEFYGTILNSHISTNNCGTDVLNNQLLLPYASYEECSKTMNPCDKYNNPELSEAKIKNQCLKDTNCGFCTNDEGKGKCIEGTATEPLDLQRYFYCTEKHYEYGDRAQYLM